MQLQQLALGTCWKMQVSACVCRCVGPYMDRQQPQAGTANSMACGLPGVCQARQSVLVRQRQCMACLHSCLQERQLHCRSGMAGIGQQQQQHMAAVRVSTQRKHMPVLTLQTSSAAEMPSSRPALNSTAGSFLLLSSFSSFRQSSSKR